MAQCSRDILHTLSSLPLPPKGKVQLLQGLSTVSDVHTQAGQIAALATNYASLTPTTYSSSISLSLSTTMKEKLRETQQDLLFAWGSLLGVCSQATATVAMGNVYTGLQASRAPAFSVATEIASSLLSISSSSSSAASASQAGVGAPFDVDSFTCLVHVVRRKYVLSNRLLIK